MRFVEAVLEEGGGIYYQRVIVFHIGGREGAEMANLTRNLLYFQRQAGGSRIAESGRGMYGRQEITFDRGQDLSAAGR